MKDDLIEPERVRAIQESLRGFLLDKVIDPAGEFYTDHRVSMVYLTKIGMMMKKKSNN
jgi:hypothetical protein